MLKLKILILGLGVLLSMPVFSQERCDIFFTKTQLCANVDWIYGPYFDQYSSAKILLSQNTQVRSIKVIPWMVMSEHEHGSRPVVLNKTADREYLVDKAYFMGGMVGHWFFRIQLFDANNSLIEENRYPIEFK